MKIFHQVSINARHCRRIVSLLCLWIFAGTTFVFAQNAPITSIDHVSSTANSTVVAVRVQNFPVVGGCNMKIGFDNSIAVLTNVTVGSGVVPSGTLNYNITVPGEVYFQWYTGSPPTLADGTTIFNLHFTKVANGTTDLVFIDDNNSYSCIYYDFPAYQPLNDSPNSTYYVEGSLTFSPFAVAPVTTIPSVSGCVGQTLTFPVTVTGFSNIGASSLSISYDPAVLTNPVFTNTSNVIPLGFFSPTAGLINISGFSSATGGVNLPDNAVFFTLSFTYLGGDADVYFNHAQPTSCQYGGPTPLYDVLYDTPKSNYFIDGQVEHIVEIFSEINDTICDGEVYQWLGNDYTTSGSYDVTGLTPGGCLSIQLLNLTVNPSYLFSTDTIVPASALPFVWMGNSYFSSVSDTLVYQTVSGCDSTYVLNLSVQSVTKILNLKVYLEGLYSPSVPGTMNQAMNFSVPQFGAGIADVITVELYDVNNLSAAVYQNQNVMLHTDGTALIDDIGLTLDGEYYVVVKHRNSIETWSAQPLLFAGNGPFNYDFTTSASQAYGNNQKSMTGGWVAVYSGDALQDGIVDASDMSLVDNASTLLTTGYVTEDLNGDGIVDGTDMLLVDNNATIIIQAQKP